MADEETKDQKTEADAGESKGGGLKMSSSWSI